MRSMRIIGLPSVRPTHATVRSFAHARLVLALALALPLAACGPAGPSLPGAPEAVAVRPLDEAVAVSWVLGSDGGSALLNHAFSLDDGDNWTAFDPPVTSGGAVIGELVNGALHRLRVRAVNARGPGAASGAVEAVAARPSYLVGAHAPGHLQVNGIASLRDGGVFVVGYHYGQASFGAIPPVESSWSERGFIATLDAGAAWRWIVDLEAGGASSIEAVAPLADGAVVVGTFGQTLDLHPFGSFTSSGGSSFVATLDRDGTWLWAEVMDAEAGSSVAGLAVAVAPDGDVVVAGTVYGTVRFGDTVVSSATTFDAFVARLAPGGGWRWVAVAGADAVTVPTTLAFTPDGGAVIGGRTRATQPVATLPATGNAGNDDGFVAALGADGASWRWVRTLGGSSNDRVEGVAVADGTLVAIGSYFGTAAFGPLGTRPPPFAAMTTAYLLRLSFDGAWESVAIVAASGGAAFRRAVARPGGGIVIAAEANGDVLFPGGVSGGVGSGPYLLDFDASEALLGVARLGRGGGVTTETGSAHVYALALGVGGVPVVGGTLYGAVNDGTTVIEQADGAFGPDLFVWKAAFEVLD